jgi:hypothetical protein
MRTEKEIREMIQHYDKPDTFMLSVMTKTEREGIIIALKWVLEEHE